MVFQTNQNGLKTSKEAFAEEKQDKTKSSSKKLGVHCPISEIMKENWSVKEDSRTEAHGQNPYV